MSDKQSHYTAFDVMYAKADWDVHTRQVVEQRLSKSPAYQSLTAEQVASLTGLCSFLLGDGRQDILDFVIWHFDQKLSSAVGEGQRQLHSPKEKDLILQGLRALDKHCMNDANCAFRSLNEHDKQRVLSDVLNGITLLETSGQSIPGKVFIEKVVTESVSAYYSHPIVWSEIGYAGPAYPRGYVRIEHGLSDPWEAKRTDES